MVWMKERIAVAELQRQEIILRKYRHFLKSNECQISIFSKEIWMEAKRNVSIWIRAEKNMFGTFHILTELNTYVCESNTNRFKVVEIEDGLALILVSIGKQHGLLASKRVFRFGHLCVPSFRFWPPIQSVVCISNADAGAVCVHVKELRLFVATEVMNFGIRLFFCN